MNRIRSLLAFLLLLPALSLSARDQKVRDLNIRLTLVSNGTVVIHETWDVDTGDKITEWYLNRENLGDITIGDFCVFDGDDELTDDGEWDVDRTRAEKAGKYGIVHKYSGVELCWGVGEYGDHVYHALYSMRRAVKSLNDYDALHLQVVSDGLSAPPQHVRVVVRSAVDGVQLDTTTTRIWGFGYEGRSSFEEDGTVVFESDGPLETDDSVIILLRFEKGIFSSPSVEDRSFDELLSIAMVGASFGEDEEENDWAEGLGGFLTLLFIWFVFIRPIWRSLKESFRDNRKLDLGFNPKKAPWYRDIPMKGDLEMAYAVLKRSGNDPSSGGLPLATILRLVHQGYIGVTREVEGPAVLSFTDKDRSGLDAASSGLYQLLKTAAGKDELLQDKEFSTWAKAHASKVEDWANKARTNGLDALKSEKWYNARKVALTPAGREEALHLFGLKAFLSDFTLIDEREAFEASLWKEYMVYGALFGITDRVSRQLKDIDPSLFRETFHYDMNEFDTVINTSAVFSRAVSQAITQSIASRAVSYSSGSYSSGHSSSHGYGGHSSHHGGGGYHGGGRGGGGR